MLLSRVYTVRPRPFTAGRKPLVVRSYAEPAAPPRKQLVSPPEEGAIMVWGLQEAHAADSSSSIAHCIVMFGRWLSFAALIHGRPCTTRGVRNEDDVLPQLAANMLVRSVIRGSPAPVYCIGAPSIYKAVRIVCEAAKNFEDKLLAVKVHNGVTSFGA
ncbi:hypothetical protein HaLaN_28493 [Haematococcus lacustris]|uniref:Uncharacterized protein n=1 Tax=Haematococcus lacustris TaxID=44745 RepID=A0A6A0ACJ9_HAELA|nr:hypothetical protein HaLaN_28493 [Haematococcus lacustris]